MWSLSYEDTDYEFDQVAVTSVQIEGRTYRVSDTPAPQSDGVMFGEDLADPGDIKLKLLVSFQSVRNIDMQRMMLNEAAHRFLGVWDAVRLRAQPGMVGELVIPSLAMFEGRPRRAEWDWSTFGLGYLTGTATFVRGDTGAFELDSDGKSMLRFAEVGIVAPVARSGWVFPLVFPIQNLEPALRATWFEVGGTTDTDCRVEIQGPIQAGAEVAIASGWRLRTNRALAYDQVAVADARHGRMLLTVNNVPTNFLAPSSSKLSELSLSPGPHQVSLRGVSPEGTARARVWWRDMKAGI